MILVKSNSLLSVRPSILFALTSKFHQVLLLFDFFKEGDIKCDINHYMNIHKLL